MGAPQSAGQRFRQRKISTKTELQILKQSQLNDSDNADLQQRDLQEIETGVDKAEEGEEHLQKILNTTGLSNTSQSYIPTPDASKVWAEAAKYYTGQFQHPESYIKSSCQVEDYSGCWYNMDERDEEFLEKYNKELTTQKREPLTEDEFEVMMYNFEKTIGEKQPFLSTDPSQILPLDDIKQALFQFDRSSVENVTEMLAEELQIHPFVTNFDAHIPKKPRELKALVSSYGNSVYDYFKGRKIERTGQPVTPVLKFNGEDDNDAYICFRQRQFRQQRKTRRADIQSSEKLVKLYLELKATKELCFMVAQRELMRLEAIETEKDIFELRCKVKAIKRDLGITDSDEDLIAHKKKKPIPIPQAVEVKDEKKKIIPKTGNNANIEKTKVPDVLDGPQQFQPYVKLPPSKIPDMELETVELLLSSKHDSMAKYVEEKLRKRKQRDIGFTNLTDDAYSPLLNISLPYTKVLDPSRIPYSSITSSFFDVESYGYIPQVDKYIEKGVAGEDVIAYNSQTMMMSNKHPPEQYNPFYNDHVLTSDSTMTLRKRVGRLGQVYIDRRIPHEVELEELDDEASERLKDQWKFDTDFTQAETLSDDPAKLNTISNDTQVIRFGGMLLSKAYETLKEAMLQQRQQLYFQQLQRLQKVQQQSPAESPQPAAPPASTEQAVQQPVQAVQR